MKVKRLKNGGSVYASGDLVMCLRPNTGCLLANAKSGEFLELESATGLFRFQEMAEHYAVEQLSSISQGDTQVAETLEAPPLDELTKEDLKGTAGAGLFDALVAAGELDEKEAV